MKKLSLLLLCLTLTGCSSSFSEANLRQATTRSTGLASHDFIIGNRENHLSSIDYDIKLNQSNKIYHCSAIFAPFSGGVTTEPKCVDQQGKQLKPASKEIRF